MKRNHAIILSAIILLALILQFYHLGYKSLWIDEASSYYYSNQSIGDYLLNQDLPIPPFYYIILHFFLFLGKSEFIIRLPSVIFGVLSIPIVYIIGKDFYEVQVGLLSAFMLAVSPTFVYYGQEGRMYTLFVFFSLLSLLFFYRALRKSDNKLWIGFIATNLLNIYTHYFAFLVIIVEILFVIVFFYKYKSVLVKFIGSLFVVLILFVPQLINLIAGMHVKLTEYGSYAPLRWGYNPDIFFVPRIIFSFFYNSYSFINSIIVMILVIIFLYFLFPLYNQCRENTTLAIIWVFLPVIAAFLLAFKINIVGRYLIFILPIYLIVVSAGLMIIKKKHTLLFIILFLLIAAANGHYLYNYYHSNFKYGDDYEFASIYIKNNLHEGDKIVSIPGFLVEEGFSYYGLNDVQKLPRYNISLEKIQEICSENPRTWVIYTHYYGGDPNSTILTWLEKDCTKKAKFEIGEIYLYDAATTRAQSSTFGLK